jgi:hypothetical protein
VGEVFRGYEDVLSAPVGDPDALALHIRELVEDMHARTTLAMHAEITATKHLQTIDTSAEAIAANLARCI